MLTLFIVVVLAAIAFLVYANFNKKFKERFAKQIVIIEGIVTTGVYWFGQASEALQEAQRAGYLPSQWLGYLPYVFLVYLFIKQVQVGKAKK